MQHVMTAHVWCTHDTTLAHALGVDLLITFTFVTQAHRIADT